MHIVMVRECRSVCHATLYLMKNYSVIVAKVSYCLSAVWNLDFLEVTGFVRPFCISHKLVDYDVLLLNFISVFFPLLLVVITYSLIELHAKDFRLVVLCWKPFHCCFITIRRNWNASDSIIHAFASLLLLSFATLNYNAYEILNSINVYDAYHKESLRKNMLYNHPTMHSYAPKYRYYMAVVFVLLLFFGALPSLLLLCYPIRIFRERVQKCFSPRGVLKLNTFVEIFHGPFKDVCNGTHDFRTVPGVIACIILLLCTLSVIGAVANYLILMAVICLALFSILFAYVRPCKLSSANVSLIFHLMWIAVLSTLFRFWRQDFTLKTTMLSFFSSIFLPVPHILMFLWLCYRIEKKLKLRERATACFNCVIRQTWFGQRLVGVLTPVLPHRLFNSHEYQELSSNS